MSYAVSAALQKAIFAALAANVAMYEALDGAIYDALPSGTRPETFVVLGSEVVKPRGDVSGICAQHDLTVSVVSEADGFAGVKTIAAMVSDVLDGADLTLERGKLVSLRFFKAKASKSKSAKGRQIDMIFRARVDDV